MRLLPGQDEADLSHALRCAFAAAGSSTGALAKTLADIGVLTLTVAVEHGGSGGALTDLGVFFAEAGRALCPLSIHSTILAALAIEALGGGEQRARWLPEMGSGAAMATTTLCNPRNAAMILPTMRAAPDGTGRWCLVGNIEFALDADASDWVIVSATDESSGRNLAFVVNTRSPGLTSDPLTLMGGQHAATLHFDGVVIDDETAVLAGADGSGISLEQLRRLANSAIALLSLDLVGVGEAALHRTVEYTKMRHQFGRPIASFQAAQHIVANMHIALSAARLAARSAVFWIGRGRTATRETAIARMHAASAAKLATLDAHQLHGGMGYIVDTDLHRYSERARILATFGGGADVAATWLTGERA